MKNYLLLQRRRRTYCQHIQSNLTKGRIAAARGRYIPYRLLYNGLLILLRTAAFHAGSGPLGAPGPQLKGHIDQFSRFCRAHDRDRQTALHR